MTISTAPPPVTGAARSRTTMIVLAISLAINLLLIGTAASAIWRWRHMPPPMPPVFHGNLLAFASTLPAARRHEIWQATEAERRNLGPLRGEVRSAQLELRKAILADPFDRDQFTKAQERMLDAETKARAEAQKLFLTIASHLTKEERESFVQAIERQRERRGPRHGWWRQRGGEPPAAETNSPVPPNAPQQANPTTPKPQQ